MAARWLLFVLPLAVLFAGRPAHAQNTSSPVPPPAIANAAENADYLAAFNIKNAAKRAQTFESFLDRYPDGTLRVEACEQAMAAWQSAGNPDRADAMAARLLQFDPDNVRALANRAFVGRTRAMAGDPRALALAVTAAHQGIAALPKWKGPASLSEPDFTRLKMQFVAIFDGTLGFAALQEKDYLGARSHFLEAVTVDPDSLPDVYQLSVALLEGQPIDATGFWYAARAIAIAHSVKNEQAAASIDKYARSRYQRYHGSEEGWRELSSRVAAGERLPPDNFSSSITRAMTAAEQAVQMVTDTDPSQLSVVEWEFVLAHGDEAQANKVAAERVWKAIGDKQQGGARLKIPVKVIAVTPDRIQAAVSEENQASNTVDLQADLDHPLSPLPATGASISIVGTLRGYRPKPFLFYFTKVELADESLPVAGGPCADPRPQMCTQEYRPACGSRRNGGRRTYANACSACSDLDVLSQAAGACP